MEQHLQVTKRKKKNAANLKFYIQQKFLSIMKVKYTLLKFLVYFLRLYCFRAGFGSWKNWGGCKDFLCTLCSHACIASHIFNTSHQNGTFYTKSELTLAHHKSLKVHSLHYDLLTVFPLHHQRQTLRNGFMCKWCSNEVLLWETGKRSRARTGRGRKPGKGDPGMRVIQA